MPNLGSLPEKVRVRIDGVRAYPLGLVTAGLGKLRGKAEVALGLTTHPEYRGLVGKVVEFQVGGTTHRLWVVNANGKPVVMRASTEGPLEVPRDAKAGREGQAATGADQLRADAAQAIGQHAKADLKGAAEAGKKVEAGQRTLGGLLSPDGRFNSVFEKVPLSPRQVPVGTDAQILAMLPNWLPNQKPNQSAQGILVVAGKAYYLTSGGRVGPHAQPLGAEWQSGLAVNAGALDKVPGFEDKPTEHVEGSAVAIIRRILLDSPELRDAKLYLNLPPCGAAYGTVPQNDKLCDKNLPLMLPVGFNLTVVFKRPYGAGPGSKPFKGTGGN